MDFNEKLFHRLVDYATVYSDGRVVFTFRNGVDREGYYWEVAWSPDFKYDEDRLLQF